MILTFDAIILHLNRAPRFDQLLSVFRFCRLLRPAAVVFF
jgi:hypothetical protein